MTEGGAVGGERPHPYRHVLHLKALMCLAPNKPECGLGLAVRDLASRQPPPPGGVAP